MKVMPVRYVTDVEASQRFYAALGLSVQQRSRSGHWAELVGSAGPVALHTASASSGERRVTDVEPCLVTDVALEEVVKALDAAGYPHEGIVEDSFGRSLTVADPDGLRIQVDEHDPSLYA